MKAISHSQLHPRDNKNVLSPPVLFSVVKVGDVSSVKITNENKYVENHEC